MNGVFAIRKKDKRRRTEVFTRPIIKDNMSTRSDKQISQNLKIRKNIKSRFDTLEREEDIKEMGSKKTLPRKRITENEELNSKINNYNPKSKSEKKLEKEKKAKCGFIKICIMIAILIFANVGSILFFFLTPNKINCSSGFFMAEDDNLNKNCLKCSVKNCEKCLGDSQTDFYFSCKAGFTPVYKNGIIISCNYNN